jgi:hypothetical protein
MGFVEDIRARIHETLAQKIDAAERELEELKEAKVQCVERAAENKLELLVLRRTPLSPTNPERLAREGALQTAIRDARGRYLKIEQDIEDTDRELSAFRGIQTDLQKGELQLIA